MLVLGVEDKAEGEMGGELAIMLGVVDRDREGDLEPLVDGRVLVPVALAASSISWRSVVPLRDMSNWLYSASAALRTSKKTLGTAGDSRIVLSVCRVLVIWSEEVAVGFERPGVVKVALPNVWTSMR